MSKAIIKDLKRLLLPILYLESINVVICATFYKQDVWQSLMSNIDREFWGTCNDYGVGKYNFYGMWIFIFGMLIQKMSITNRNREHSYYFITEINE